MKYPTGVAMSYRIFDVSPRGVARERRQQVVAVDVERRQQTASSRTQREMLEWDKLRARFQEDDADIPSASGSDAASSHSARR